MGNEGVVSNLVEKVQPELKPEPGLDFNVTKSSIDIRQCHAPQLNDKVSHIGLCPRIKDDQLFYIRAILLIVVLSSTMKDVWKFAMLSFSSRY